MVTLIDLGATHNFISSTLVSQLKLPINDTEPYGVQMGTEDKETGRGICKGVLLQLEGIDVVEEFLSLRLGSSDIILGVKWLETLGTTQTNWKTQTMAFEVGGESVCLKGDPSLGKSLITLKAMSRELKKEKGGVLIELSNSELEKHEEVEPPEFLRSL